MSKLDVRTILTPSPVAREGAARGVKSQRDSIVGIEQELNGMFVRRRDEVRMMVMAALTGEHMLFLARTGAGKSGIVEQFLKRLDGAKFETQCGKEDREHRYFGPIDPVHYAKEGRYVRPKEGFIQSADWAFLDEVFDAPDVILRMLNKILNERQYKEADGQYHRVPLKTTFATANYVRINAILEAFVERFSFTALPTAELSAADLLRIDLNRNEGRFEREPEHRLSLEDIDALSKALEEVFVPADVEYLKGLLLTSFRARINQFSKTAGSEEPKFQLSGRRSVVQNKVLKAAALMDGRSEVCDDDLSTLDSCIGADVLVSGIPAVRAKFGEAVRGTTMNFSGEQAMAQLRVIGAAIDGRGVKRGEAEVLRELVGIDKRLPKGLRDEREIVRWMVKELSPSSTALAEFKSVYLEREAEKH